ncbi:MAG: acyl-CoA/acyl-ACP dehydrogenase [Deltaproteobacteria bacterium]|nr:acyl-CoA/acyl-ACP dehydrogenase [Deltaproteobacteria bacterium]
MDYLDISLQLSEDDIAIKNAAHEFAEEIMRPAAKALDEMSAEDGVAKKSPLWPFLKKSYELGYHRILLPEAYGGLSLSPLQLNLVLEEWGWGSMGLGVLLGVAAFPFFAIALTGDDELIEKYVIPFCECTDGSIRGCWCGTEPEHGSDILYFDDFFKNPKIKGNVQARLKGDSWIINGQKSAWVSGGTIATHGLTFLQVDPSKGMAGGGVCVVPLDKGVSRGKPLEKIGQRDLNQSEVFFDDTKIPANHMITEPDYYPEMVDLILGAANAAMSALATGVARAAFEEALVYARERVQGGVPITKHTSVRQRLFDMFAKVEACRALSRAVFNFNFNVSPPVTEYSIAAKTRCTQTCFEVTHEAIQILGGNGLAREYLVEKIFRDARASLVEDGLNEMLAAAGGLTITETYPRKSSDIY